MIPRVTKETVFGGQVAADARELRPGQRQTAQSYAVGLEATAYKVMLIPADSVVPIGHTLATLRLAEPPAGLVNNVTVHVHACLAKLPAAKLPVEV